VTVLPTSEAFLDFWRSRHLCTVTTLRRDGTPHVVPMGVVIDPESDVAWAITSGASVKARNLLAANGSGPIAVCCVDGRNWSTLEGTATVLVRYKVPRENPERVALRIEVTRVLGNVR
jgi:general stress protein 26